MPSLSPDTVCGDQYIEKFRLYTVIREEHPSKERATFRGAPPVAYMLGNIDILELDGVAIVGPRKPSTYAEHVLKDFCAYLPKYVLRTVSGGAEGIDMQAHTLSIEYGIPTIMVIGSGLRRYIKHPLRRALVERIINQGGLIYSAFTLDQSPTYYTFPQRNRYIAGLSKCLFIPEAGVGSGSLITVDFASRMHKPCYGVSQNIYTPTSKGIFTACAQDKLKIIGDLRMPFKHFVLRTESKNASASEQDTQELADIPSTQESMLISSLLKKHGRLSIDALLFYAKQDSNRLLGTLMEGELAGWREEIAPGMYELSAKSKRYPI